MPQIAEVFRPDRAISPLRDSARLSLPPNRDKHTPFVCTELSAYTCDLSVRVVGKMINWMPGRWHGWQESIPACWVRCAIAVQSV